MEYHLRSSACVPLSVNSRVICRLRAESHINNFLEGIDETPRHSRARTGTLTKVTIGDFVFGVVSLSCHLLIEENFVSVWLSGVSLVGCLKATPIGFRFSD